MQNTKIYFKQGGDELIVGAGAASGLAAAANLQELAEALSARIKALEDAEE